MPLSFPHRDEIENRKETYKRELATITGAGRARVPAYAARGTATGQLASPGRAAASAASRESSDPSEDRGHRAPRGSLPVARPASCRRQSDSEPGDTAIASAVAPVRQRRPRSVSPAAAVRTQNAKHKNLPRDLPWIEYFRRKCLACPGLAPVSPFSSIKQSRYSTSRVGVHLEHFDCS